MDGITKQTRRKSYDGIRTRSGERCKLILETLGNRSMTVEEITDELVAAFWSYRRKGRAQTAEHHDRLRGRDRAHYRIK